MGKLWAPSSAVLYTRNSRRFVPTAAPAVDSGTITLDLPELTADLDAVEVNSGALTLSLPELSAALTGQGLSAGTLAAVLPELAAALAGQVRADGALAATLPELQLGLTAQAIAAGQLALDLPELTADVDVQAISTGNVDLVLPQLAAALMGEVRADAVLSADLPELALGLTGAVVTGESLLALVLPELTASMQGQARDEGTLNAQLPLFTMNVQAEQIDNGAVSLTLPEMQMTLSVIAQVTGDGQIFWGLPTLGMMSGRELRRMREEESQRRVTREFIQAASTLIVLTPSVITRKASGATDAADGVPRAPQMFRLIAMEHNARPHRNNSGVDQGVMSRYDFTLLGEYGAVVEQGDWWEDLDGQKWIVDSVQYGNGYEVKAMVTSYGKSP